MRYLEGEVGIFTFSEFVASWYGISCDLFFSSCQTRQDFAVSLCLTRTQILWRQTIKTIIYVSMKGKAFPLIWKKSRIRRSCSLCLHTYVGLLILDYWSFYFSFIQKTLIRNYLSSLHWITGWINTERQQNPPLSNQSRMRDYFLIPFVINWRRRTNLSGYYMHFFGRETPTLKSLFF